MLMPICIHGRSPAIVKKKFPVSPLYSLRAGNTFGAFEEICSVICCSMSELSAQLSAFKNKIRSGPSVPVARRTVPQKPAPVDNSNSVKRVADPYDEAAKRQRTTGPAGSRWSTQLHLAVEYIKEQNAPVPVPKLQSYLSFDITPTLLPLLKEVNRIKYNPNNNTLEYTSLHNINTPEALLEFLRTQPTFKGTPVKDLKDGWPGYLQAILDLEEEGKVIVLRTKKENMPRLVWANLGGIIGAIDEDFKERWGKIKLPHPDDMYQSLIDQSIKPTGADPLLLNKKPQQQEKKKKKTRKGKITNTHMKGKLKDYSQMV